MPATGNHRYVVDVQVHLHIGDAPFLPSTQEKCYLRRLCDKPHRIVHRSPWICTHFDWPQIQLCPVVDRLPLPTVARQISPLHRKSIGIFFIAFSAQQPTYPEFVGHTRMQPGKILVDPCIAIVVCRKPMVRVDLDQLAVTPFRKGTWPLIVIKSISSTAPIRKKAPVVADTSDRSRAESLLKSSVVDQVWPDTGTCRVWPHRILECRDAVAGSRLCTRRGRHPERCCDGQQRNPRCIRRTTSPAAPQNLPAVPPLKATVSLHTSDIRLYMVPHTLFSSFDGLFLLLVDGIGEVQSEFRHS